MAGDSTFTRRRALQLGAGATLGSSALVSRAAWASVRDSQFMPASQLLEWQRELDALGLRATGSPVQEGYVDVLRDRLERIGVRELHFEPVPHRRWLADSWSLHTSTASGAHAVSTASYIPYSGGTPGAGVTGPLVQVDPSKPLG
ncbi:MAG TPA: hypothetical protein VGX45_17465, partial [Solirubrobacteraceae bacterium]|nr:hypothetical protein [Solirubrobacteraceae bacterium]